MYHIMNWWGVASCTALRSRPADCLLTRHRWDAGSSTPKGWTGDQQLQVEKPQTLSRTMTIWITGLGKYCSIGKILNLQYKSCAYSLWLNVSHGTSTDGNFLHVCEKPASLTKWRYFILWQWGLIFLVLLFAIFFKKPGKTIMLAWLVIMLSYNSHMLG